MLVKILKKSGRGMIVNAGRGERELQGATTNETLG